MDVAVVRRDADGTAVKGLIYAGLSLLLAMLTFLATPVVADAGERAPDLPDIDDLSVW